MTPTIEKLNNQEQIEYLGMDSDTLKRIIVPVQLQNTIIDSAPIDFKYLLSSIENACEKQQTPLDQCLETLWLSFNEDSFAAFIYEEKPDLAIAVLHDVLMMKLFPPRNMYMDSEILNLPIFEVEYLVSNIPRVMNKNNIIQSILKAKEIFEGEFLFEILNKAVRSQRNKIEKPFTQEAISEAFELIERENYNVTNILMNSKAYSMVRNNIEPIENTYRNIPVINFTPSGRMNKNRVFFMGNPQTLGRIAKTKCRINIEEIKEDKYNISCLLRMGAVILNREIISVIEH